MRLRYKLILLGFFVVISVVTAFPVISILLFKRERAKMIRETPAPPYLTQTEISIIETMLGVTFPVTTSQIKTYFGHGHRSFYCFAEFDQKDLEHFKQGRDWVSSENSQATIQAYLLPPLRAVPDGFLAAEPIEWWTPSREHAQWVSRIVPANDPGGYIVILLEKSPTGGVRAYLTMGAVRSAFPREILKMYPSNKIGWDLRESTPYPKQGKHRS